MHRSILRPKECKMYSKQLKILESQLEDALGSLVEAVETVETEETVDTVTVDCGDCGGCRFRCTVNQTCQCFV